MSASAGFRFWQSWLQVQEEGEEGEGALKNSAFFSHLHGLVEEHEKLQAKLQQVLLENPRLSANAQQPPCDCNNVGLSTHVKNSGLEKKASLKSQLENRIATLSCSKQVVSAENPSGIEVTVQSEAEKAAYDGVLRADSAVRSPKSHMSLQICTGDSPAATSITPHVPRALQPWRRSSSSVSSVSQGSQPDSLYPSEGSADSEPELLEDCVWKVRAFLKMPPSKTTVSMPLLLDAVQYHPGFQELNDHEQAIQDLFGSLKAYSSFHGDHGDKNLTAQKSLHRRFSFKVHEHRSIPLDTLAKAVLLSEFAAKTAESALLMNKLREYVLAENATNAVLRALKLSDFSSSNNSSIVERGVEALSSSFIIANVLCLGLFVRSRDGGFGTPQIVDMLFLSFFTFEIAFKIYRNSARIFFRGEDWRWNCFDVSVVGLGLCDLILTLSGFNNTSSSAFTALRIVRLVRLIRMVRLFRVNIFRELKLMLHGVMTMMRTMLCSVFLLIFIVYFLSIILVYLMSDVDGGDELVTRQDLLFSTVPKAMFTVFRCICTGDCAARDGTPIALQLSESVGWPFTLCYCGICIFMTYGMGSLITAMVVDSTINAAKQGEFKSSMRQVEREKLANNLLQLTSLFQEAQKHVASLSPEPPENASQMFYMTREVFSAICEKREVKALFDAIDVDEHDQTDLFDSLDVDGNGRLHLHELIGGLVKMRGKARKSDIVASRMLMEVLAGKIATVEHTLKKHGLLVDSIHAHMNEVHTWYKHTKHHAEHGGSSSHMSSTLGLGSIQIEPPPSPSSLRL